MAAQDVGRKHRCQPRRGVDRRGKKTLLFAIGATGAPLTGKDRTLYTVHRVQHTTALGIGTANTILNDGGNALVFITSEPWRPG